MADYTIRSDGAFTFSIETDTTDWLLKCDGGEWRLTNVNAPWIAQARVDRWEALARAMRVIEAERNRT